MRGTHPSSDWIPPSRCDTDRRRACLPPVLSLRLSAYRAAIRGLRAIPGRCECATAPRPPLPAVCSVENMRYAASPGVKRDPQAYPDYITVSGRPVCFRADLSAVRSVSAFQCVGRRGGPRARPGAGGGLCGVVYSLLGRRRPSFRAGPCTRTRSAVPPGRRRCGRWRRRQCSATSRASKRK